MSALTQFLQPGTRAFVSAMANESARLRQALAAEPGRAAGVTFCGVQFPGIDRIDYLGVHDDARLEACFMSPSARAGLAQGRAELLALDYAGLSRHFMSCPAPDVAIAQLTPPDADGWCAPGLACDFMPLVWPRAKCRVAHLNPRLPRLPGSFRVHLSELNAYEEADAELLDYTEPAAGELEARIAAHAINFVRDGDTVQLGIGTVPMAMASALHNHRRLRLHTGMVSDSLRALWQHGALDADARITTGMVLGGPALRELTATLPQLWLTDVRHTHLPRAIAGALPAHSRFVAINGAVEVDLFGQVNSERASGVLQAGAGGLPAFAQAAQSTPDGRLLICLPATARKGTLSRIVPALGNQALCTVPRTLVDVVITEHGAAQLRGLGLQARAQALMAIAAPEHRDALASAWDQMQRTL